MSGPETVAVDLAGKVAVIVGATGEIGSACAREFATRGAKVGLLGRDEARLRRAVKETRAAGVDADSFQIELTSDESVARAMAECRRRFGRIDMLVNASAGGDQGRFLELTDDQWRHALDVKVLGYARAIRHAIVAFTPDGGSIVNVAGTGGREPKYFAAAVSVGNAAIVSLTKILADELAPRRIRVNAVSPGQVRTERYRERISMLASQGHTTEAAAEEAILGQIPLRRPADLSEVAGVVAFLASERSSYMTGACLIVDGGWTRSAI